MSNKGERVNDVVRTSGRWVRPQVLHIPPLYGTDPYITRFILFRTPLFGVYVHKIWTDDGERDFHNHPRQFWSLILRGGYIEEVTTGPEAPRERDWHAGSVHKMELEHYHSITMLIRKPSWSLLLVGRFRQEWGFMTEDGFINADDYKAYIEGSNSND